MPIDETELRNDTVGTTTDAVPNTEVSERYPVEDFRLRLDSPLFHRDAGLGGADGPQAPSLRELTWEHVVRPNAHQSMIAQESGPAKAVVARCDAADITTGMADLLRSLRPVSAAPLITIESLSPSGRAIPEPVVDVPVVDVPVGDVPVGDVPVGESPVYESPVVEPVVEVPVDEVPAGSEWMAVPRADQSTGLSADPPIETLLAALKHMDEVAQQYMPAPRERESVAEEAPARGAAAQSPVPLAGLERTRAIAESAVEAELNRLAYLPDRNDEPGPVALPAIVYSEQPVVAAAPALSRHEMYTPRQPAPAVHPRSLFSDLAASPYPAPSRKKRRGVMRRVVTFVVLLAMLAGGLFAAKYYLLDPQWKGEMKAIAQDVEQARGLEFDRAVTVITLPIDDYAVELATRTLRLDEGTLEATAGEWRALGVLSGELDLRAIGLAALGDSPAFYDPASANIYVAEGVPDELARFGLHRALTMALLDQVYEWGDRVGDASGSVAVGTRALYDADALATAVAMTQEAERSEIIMQLFGIYELFEIPLTPSPFASSVAGRLGIALQPFVESVPVDERAALLADAAISDAQALDLRRLASGAQESPPATSRGMLFWYHVLAGRMDSDTAWATALAWRGDAVSTVVGINGVCVVANISVEPSALDLATGAFQQWAAAGPAGAAATVAAATVGTEAQVTVTACDPGAAVPTNDGRPRLSLGGAPLRAEQYRQLLTTQPLLAAAQAACAVFGGDGLTMNDERGVVDPVTGWLAPTGHPAPDPNRLGCAA